MGVFSEYFESMTSARRRLQDIEKTLNSQYWDILHTDTNEYSDASIAQLNALMYTYGEVCLCTSEIEAKKSDESKQLLRKIKHTKIESLNHKIELETSAGTKIIKPLTDMLRCMHHNENQLCSLVLLENHDESNLRLNDETFSQKVTITTQFKDIFIPSNRIPLIRCNQDYYDTNLLYKAGKLIVHCDLINQEIEEIVNQIKTSDLIRNPQFPRVVVRYDNNKIEPILCVTKEFFVGYSVVRMYNII